MFSFIKDLYQWISKKDNRYIAFKYYRIGMAIAKQAAKFTPTIKDDEGLAYLTKKTDMVLARFTDESRGRFFQHIHDTKKGVLKNLEALLDPEADMFNLKVKP